MFNKWLFNEIADERQKIALLLHLLFLLNRVVVFTHHYVFSVDCVDCICWQLVKTTDVNHVGLWAYTVCHCSGQSCS